MRGPSLTGLGKRPVFTPAHQVDLLTGIGLPGPMMEDNLRKPVLGSSETFDMKQPRSIEDDEVLCRRFSSLAELGFGKTEVGFR